MNITGTRVRLAPNVASDTAPEKLPTIIEPATSAGAASLSTIRASGVLACQQHNATATIDETMRAGNSPRTTRPFTCTSAIVLQIMQISRPKKGNHRPEKREEIRLAAPFFSQQASPPCAPSPTSQVNGSKGPINAGAQDPASVHTHQQTPAETGSSKRIISAIKAEPMAARLPWKRIERNCMP